MSRIATTPGLLPSPVAPDDGGGGPTPVVAADSAVRDAHLAAQRDADLDRVVEGQAGWWDGIVHPLVAHDNVARGPLAHSTAVARGVYRRPVVAGPLTFDGGLGADLAAVADRTASLQAVVPGPYTLSTLATDDHYGDPVAFQAAIAAFLADELAALPDAVATVFVLEPSLIAAPPGDGADERASDAIDTVAAAVTDADVVVHTYGGALDEKVHAHLLDAAIDAVGYDLIANHEDAAYLVGEYGTADSIALGVANARTPAVDAPATLRERVDWFDDRTPNDFATVYTTTDSVLATLPQSRLVAQLRALGAATTPQS
ncbi:MULTISPECIES: 5-methyltetrahydropteroyltriglutamate--homocysteine methyltransferase [Halobacterium]|uniref:5-methyltetrahydropteroyltriglutamate-- homocysteine methyltransferase n=1 Tax=Halobacterium TaxID=2239 RepID=UPI0019652724|nr:MULTISPECIES: 5-methyltetrahydropteroyltriglutamate--homocysteine methyltransferase [Halobacterium]MDL0121804.1 5-methyltetrahydropteroyltriglutamate--homocysteine methyltransferase [Halobacterium salinarum]QRY25673.1 5-methyltetrahydropteroyltriglutamate--homocysteine methyltransferase [Halobacterium sp. BOL4-2]